MDYNTHYYKENHLIINVEKSTCCIADGNLSHQPEVKLLSVIFNQHAKFDFDIDALVIERQSLPLMQ